MVTRPTDMSRLDKVEHDRTLLLDLLEAATRLVGSEIEDMRDAIARADQVGLDLAPLVSAVDAAYADLIIPTSAPMPQSEAAGT